MNSEKSKSSCDNCNNCIYIENLIMEAYSNNQDFKDALNMIIEKNNIILEQNKVIKNLEEQLKKFKI